MNKDTNPYFVGFVAASVFAVMMYVFTSMGIFVLVPVMFGALPIYVAALGWGTKAGIVATVVIMIFTGIATDPAAGLLIGMTIAAPAALAGHQANLAQRAGDGSHELVWYPISRILFSLTLLIAGAILVFGLMLGFDPAKLGPQIAEQFQSQLTRMPEVNGGREVTLDEIGRANSFILGAMPFLLPSIWVGIHVINLLLGLRITRSMGVLARPDEDIASKFALPPFTLALMIVALVGMVSTNAPLQYGFGVAAGALSMAFAIVGLAAMHVNIRGWSVGRGPMLVLTYTMIIVFFIPVYLFTFSGILRTARGGKDNPNSDN